MKTPPQRSSELLHARGRQLLRAFTDRRPSGNGLGYCWSQARLSLRIPKTQPTSLPVAWEISAIVRRKLPRTLGLLGSDGCTVRGYQELKWIFSLNCQTLGFTRRRSEGKRWRKKYVSFYLVHPHWADLRVYREIGDARAYDDLLDDRARYRRFGHWRS